MRITTECLERTPGPDWVTGTRHSGPGKGCVRMLDERENDSPGRDLGSGRLAHHHDSPPVVCYVEARTISRAISVGCGAGCAGYPNSVRTAAIAASATATGLNSTVVRGGELISPVGLAST